MRTLENIIRYVRNLIWVKIIFPIFGRKQKKKKYYASICAIFKNEGKYFREWIEYYLITGIEHFYLYNNNSEDNYKKVLKPYVDQGIVTLIDWPEKPGQMSAYNHCIKEFSDETNWIGFIDLDEFVCPVKFDTIPEWLNKYQKLPSVYMHWRLFSSSGIIEENEKLTTIEQFTVCGGLIRSSKVFLNTDWSKRVKNFKTPHAIRFKGIGLITQKHADLLFSLRKELKDDSKIEVQMNHYYVKSFDYFVNNKCVRGDVLKDKAGIYDIPKFFYIENQCYRADFHIFKYLVKLKLKLNQK